MITKPEIEKIVDLVVSKREAGFRGPFPTEEPAETEQEEQEDEQYRKQ